MIRGTKYPAIKICEWTDLPGDFLIVDEENDVVFSSDHGAIYFALHCAKEALKAYQQATEDRGGLENRVGWKLVHGKFPEVVKP